MQKSKQIQDVPEITEVMSGFKPSEAEQEIVGSVYSKFRIAQDERNRSFKFFNDRTLVEYINDSVHNYLANEDAREGIEDWQARVHDKFTSNKVTAFLGRATKSLPIPTFTARGDEDTKRSHILNDLYMYSEDVDNYEENMVYVLEEALVKGTAIIFEGMRLEEGTRRYVKGSGDSISIKDSKYSETKLYSELVPLEEFYPATVRNKRLQDNTYVFWRNEIAYEQFVAEWGSMYEKAHFVLPHSGDQQVDELPFYVQNTSPDTRAGNVEVIRYYNKAEDQFVIIANGIWINPLETKDNPEEVAPLPFNHKQLPFWSMKFEVKGDWFYGGSLPDKLLPMQAVLNVLTNMLLDQSFMTIFPPMLTNGFDTIEDDYLRPGRRTPIDTQGLPISQSFMKLDLGTPGGWHQFILDYTRNVMQESSLDQVSSGVAGGGDRTTAKEISTAAQGVDAILSMFDRLRNSGLKEKAYLRGANILQFWTDPNTPYLTGILSETGREKTSKAFNTFEVDGTILSDGKRGTRIIEMFKEDSQLPSSGQLEARSLVANADTGKQIEFEAITPKYIRNFRFDIEMQLNPRNEQTKEIEKAMQLEKVRVYLSFFPEMVNKEELLAQTAEVMGDDPEKVIAEQILNPQPEQQQGPEIDSGVSTQPQSDVANNMVRSEVGGSGGAQSLGQLGL